MFKDIRKAKLAQNEKDNPNVIDNTATAVEQTIFKCKYQYK